MPPFSVSQFIDFVNVSLATAVFPEGVTVEGEVAEYRVSQDKWIWFKLKDEKAVVECFATTWQLRTPLEDGMKVRIFGGAKLYPRSGKFSLSVERVELVGEGALRRAFELLKKKLAEEGLFDVGRKRPIPRFPERIGLIASRESAAYGDFLRILGNRWGGIAVHAASVAVQGRDAIAEITGAFRYFNEHPELAEVIVLTRGGGSLEDLQAFNSEDVARAVFSSHVPVIVGVGHERDESLADYVADLRASTPTNAAELLAPDRREIMAFIAGAERRIDSTVSSSLRERRALLDEIAGRIESHSRAARDRVAHAIKDFFRQAEGFGLRMRHEADRVNALAARADAAFALLRGRRADRVAAAERLLAQLDPRAILAKGYALVWKNGKVVKDAAGVDTGDRLDIQLGKGKIAVQATDTPLPV